jgi:hypothetical protein
MIPETPSSVTIGKRIRESVTARSWSARSKRPITQGAMTMNTAVSPVRPSRRSQKRLEATRHARARSPFSSSSVKTGTKAEESAASATSARKRFGTWKATVKALIPAPSTPK